MMIKLFLLVVAVLAFTDARSRSTRATIKLYDSSGTITSPGYPQGYDGGSEQRWELRTPGATAYTIYFDDVDLSNNGCTDDIGIMDVSDYSAPMISVCDERSPLRISTDEINIYFRVNTIYASARGTGFSIRFQAEGAGINPATTTTSTTTTTTATSTSTTTVPPIVSTTETKTTTEKYTPPPTTTDNVVVTDPVESTTLKPTTQSPSSTFPQGTQDDSQCGLATFAPQITGLDYVAQGEAVSRGIAYSQPSLRVVNGEEAVPHSWPWQVSLQGSYGSAYCGGTLVHPQWVVTAAHCAELVFIGVYGGDVALLGAHDKRVEENSQQIITIKAKYSHPQYDTPDRANDVALLKLEHEAVLNEFVGLACEAHSDWAFPAGMSCVVTGWGVTTEGGNIGTNILQQGVVPLMSDEDCYTLYQQANLDTTSDMQCAGGQGKGACNGDSGGPLNCYVNGRWYHAGIVSFGEANCDTDIASVYGKVASHRDFIDQTISAYS